METQRTIFLSVAFVTGLFLSAWILGRSVERFRTQDRTISVKGLSEREVMADLAVWNLRTRVAGNDLGETSKGIEVAKDKIVSFLNSKGIASDNIVLGSLSVRDRRVNEWADNRSGEVYRFFIDRTIQVRSSDVLLVERVSRMTEELLSAGVLLTNQGEYDGAVRFIFTKLNDIKPEMLTEATQNAKRAAEQFTSESGTKLGGLRRANQGFFSIIDRNAFLSSSSDDEGYGSNSMDIYKKVRVVVNVEYAVE